MHHKECFQVLSVWKHPLVQARVSHHPLGDENTRYRYDEKYDGQANGHVKERAFHTPAGAVDTPALAAKDATQATRALGLNEDHANERDGDDDLYRLHVRQE